jgi:cell shape-determining protein MreC
MLIVSVVVVILFLFDLVSGGMVRTLARSAASIVSAGFAHVSNAILLSGYLRSQSSLAAENATLASRVRALEERAALTMSLQNELATLKSIVHLAEHTTGIAAPIVSSGTASPYGTFFVGAGSAEGVSVGSIVLSPEGFALGQITSVRSHDSTALELFVSGGSILGVIGTSTHATIQGLGSSNAKASVPHGLPISVGDVVSSSGVEGRPIGVVGHIDQNPSSADMTLYIGLPVNLSTLQYVYIVPALAHL